MSAILERLQKVRGILEVRSGIEEPHWVSTWDDLREWAEKSGIVRVDLSELWRALPRDVQFSVAARGDELGAGAVAEDVRGLDEIAQEAVYEGVDRERIEDAVKELAGRYKGDFFASIADGDRRAANELYRALDVYNMAYDAIDFVANVSMVEVAEIAAKYVQRGHDEHQGLLGVFEEARSVLNGLEIEMEDMLRNELASIVVSVLASLSPPEYVDGIRDDGWDRIQSLFDASSHISDAIQKADEEWRDPFWDAFDGELSTLGGLVASVDAMVEELEDEFRADRDMPNEFAWAIYEVA